MSPSLELCCSLQAQFDVRSTFQWPMTQFLCSEEFLVVLGKTSFVFITRLSFVVCGLVILMIVSSRVWYSPKVLQLCSMLMATSWYSSTAMLKIISYVMLIRENYTSNSTHIAIDHIKETNSGDVP